MNQHLKSLWLTETVRLIEKENGRFQDDEVNRLVRSNKASLSERIVHRADMISEQYGLKQIQSSWLASAKLSIAILCILALFIGSGLAFSALAHNPVNLYWALLCLLGIHFVTLLLWLISCVFISNESGSLLIHIWLWLTTKLSQKKTVSQLLPAFIALFSKQIRWLIGGIVNLFWSVMLFSAFIILIILLSTQNYSFVWQTTLLTPDSVIKITHFLGWLPSVLGFTLPDTEMVRISQNAVNEAEIRSAWAIWLLGIFVVYGLAVRIILLVFCWLKWLSGSQNITLNLQNQQYQSLANELQPIAVKSIIDVESPTIDRTHFVNNQKSQHVVGCKHLLIAIDVEQNWSSPENIEFLGFLNNNQQRKAILDFLQLQPAEKLLIAVDTDRSPDRGMLNLIKSLIQKSTHSKLWFINQGRQFTNWQECLADLDLEQATPTWLLNGDKNG